MKFFTCTEAFKLLNGVFCIQKSKNLTMEKVCELLKKYLIKDLNDLEHRALTYRKKPVYVEESSSGDVIEVGHVTALDYARHPLVVGPLYREADLDIQPVHSLDYASSGLCLMAINDGTDLIENIRKSRPLKVYQSDCRLGRSTLNYMDTGKIVEKTTFGHVTKDKINKTARRLAGKYQKILFEVCGAPLQSQEAYEAASKGLMRPKEDSSTIIYKAECTEFQKPHFSLEFYTINETDEYLKSFINDLGITLRSSACCQNLIRIRHGPFDLNHALLMKHWTLENILRNIVWCSHFLTPEALKLPWLISPLDKTAIPAPDKHKYIETVVSDLDVDPEESDLSLSELEINALNSFYNNDTLKQRRLLTRPEIILPLMERNALDIDKQ